jgi:hypothetical protein
MNASNRNLTRRLVLFAGAGFLQSARAFAAEQPVIDVHQDPSCSCCLGWIQHLQKAGFQTNVFETRDVDAVKKRLGVPDDLAACHTAEIGGYIVEGHVSAAALKRFLSEKPKMRGLAVPGMPIGFPGMEGSTPEPYDVVMFGPNGQQVYMQFVGERPI